jgi:MYXO-CTERM domain-containing protein
MLRPSLAACVLAGAFVGAAHASLTDTIAQVNATATELEEAGYSRVGTGPFVSGPSGECSVNGCFDLVGAEGVLPTKGFFEFRFFNYEFSPVYYSGLFAILNIDFGASTITPQSFISQVNAQTGLTGITAMTTAQASDAQQTSFFNEWLPGDLQASIVFKWTPLNPPTSPGLSQIFTFAWDLNDATAFNNGLSLNGAYGVPTPGALALLGLAGFVGRRRSR